MCIMRTVGTGFNDSITLQRRVSSGLQHQAAEDSDLRADASVVGWVGPRMNENPTHAVVLLVEKCSVHL